MVSINLMLKYTILRILTIKSEKRIFVPMWGGRMQLEFPRYNISVSNVAPFYGIVTSNSDQIVCLILALPTTPHPPHKCW